VTTVRDRPRFGGPARLRANAQVAQLVEHVTENHGVGGSIPPLGTTHPCQATCQDRTARLLRRKHDYAIRAFAGFTAAIPRAPREAFWFDRDQSVWTILLKWIGLVPATPPNRSPQKLHEMKRYLVLRGRHASSAQVRPLSDEVLYEPPGRCLSRAKTTAVEDVTGLLGNRKLRYDQSAGS
jgi:hypothetical protein